MAIPERITCVDCGGVASLISFLPEDLQPEPGSVVSYRCADCLERFDIVVDEMDLIEDT
jgi:hypothetical protein